MNNNHTSDSKNNNPHSLLLIVIVEFCESGIVKKYRITDSDLLPFHQLEYQQNQSQNPSIEIESNSIRQAETQQKHDCSKANVRYNLRSSILLQLYKDANTDQSSLDFIPDHGQTYCSDQEALKIAAISAINDDTSILEIYDEKLNEFVQIGKQDAGHNGTHLHHFGRRIRCRVTNCAIPTFCESKIQTNVPMIKGRFFHFSPLGIPFAGKTLKVEERLNSGEVRTGFNVWDGSLLLARYIELFPEKVVSKRVLELGSGCGLVGIAAAFLPVKHITLTDLDYVIPIMEENVERNRENLHNHATVECKVCDWFTATPSDIFSENEESNVILVADCVWVKSLVHPLLRILREFTSGPHRKDIKIIMSYQRRGKDTHDLFYQSLYESFEVNEMDVGSAIEGRRLPDIFYLFECSAKCEDR